jgi:two-component system sensor histidine kinase DctS
MLSHELNQPLAAIASYASGGLNLLETESPSGHSAEDLKQIKIALERITAQSERAGLVIKSVHDFVRRRETERASIAPQSLLKEVMPLLGLLAKQMGIRLELEIEKNLPPIWCDKTMIEQVIINLARNGMQSMGMHTMGTQGVGMSMQKTEATDIKRRILTLTARASDAEHVTGAVQVEFHIQDRGLGLTPEISDKLFTPFFTTKMEGMGLGLSLCRTVIEQHGGSLTYTTNTKPPLTGTTFSFKLMTHHADLA